MSTDLNLGVIGNCVYNALIDQRGRIVWCCLPRFDGDPVFCDLLRNGGEGDEPRGVFEIDMEGLAETEQSYIPNTAVLVTRLTDRQGRALEIVDFAPRFNQFGRRYRPTALMPILRPVAGSPPRAGSSSSGGSATNSSTDRVSPSGSRKATNS